MSCHYDPEERTFLYILYVQSVQITAEASYPETAVVCRWYVDSADDCSGQFTVASGVEAYPNYFAALCVSHKDTTERSKDLTMTLTVDSTHICCAYLNLEHYPCEDTVLPAQLPLQTQDNDNVVTLAYANVLLARQPRYWSDAPPVLSAEAFFVPPLAGDSQVDALYNHFDAIYKHIAGGMSEAAADPQATAGSSPSVDAEAEEQGRREAQRAAEAAEHRRAAEQREGLEREAEEQAGRRAPEPARRRDQEGQGPSADRAGRATEEPSCRRGDDNERPARGAGSAALAAPEPDEGQREAEPEGRRREEREERGAGRQVERRQWEEDRERLREYARRERHRELEERERRAAERRRQVQALTQARLASAPSSPSAPAAAAGAELQDAIAAARGPVAARGGSPARDPSAESRRESARPSVLAAAAGRPRGGREPPEAAATAAGLGQGARRGAARPGGRQGAGRGGAVSGGSSDASEPCEFYAPPAEAEELAQEFENEQARPRLLARRQPAGRGPKSAARAGAARQTASQLRQPRLSSSAHRATGSAATRLEERGATALLVETAPAEPADAVGAPRSVASAPQGRRVSQARASGAAHRGPGGAAAGSAARPGGQGGIVAAALAEAAASELSGLGILPVSKVEECVLRLLVLQRELQGGESAHDRGRAALADAAASLAPRMLHMLESAKGVCDANRAKLRAFCEESSLDANKLGLGDKDYLAPQLASLDRLHRQYSSLSQPVPTPVRAQEVAVPAGAASARPGGRATPFAGGPQAAFAAAAGDPFAAAAELREALGAHPAPHGVYARGFADAHAAPEQCSTPIGISSRPGGMAPVVAGGVALQPAAAAARPGLGGALGAPRAAPSGGGTPPRGESPPLAFPVNVHTGLNTPSGGFLAARPAAGGEDALRHSPLDPGACGPQLPILRSGGPGSTPPSVSVDRARRGAAAAAAAASAASWAAPTGGGAAARVALRSSPSDPLISAASSEAGGPGPTWSSLVDHAGPGPAARAPQRFSEEGAQGDGTGSEGPAPTPRRPLAAPRDGGPDADSSAPGTPPRGPLRAALQQLRGVADELVPPAARRRPAAPSGGDASGGAAAGSPSRGEAGARERTGAAPAGGGAVRSPPEDKYLRILQSLQAKGATGGLAAQLLQGASVAAKAPRARGERRRRTESTSASGSSSDDGPRPVRRPVRAGA